MRALCCVVCFGITVACHSLPRQPHEPSTPPSPPGATAVSKAIHYLWHTQVTAEQEARGGGDWAGNWPQHWAVRDGPFALRGADVNAGVPAVVHWWLCPVREDNADILHLDVEDVRRARAMRKAAVALMRRFEEHGGPAAGCYGWWPRRAKAPDLADRVLMGIVDCWAGGPYLYGPLAPPDAVAFPVRMQFWPDLDVTALVTLALDQDARLDGGAARPPAVAPLFTPWRDLDAAARTFPRWLEPRSGAFLTWAGCPSDGRVPNDVDLCVNANVLLALARHGELEAPGAREATDLIVRATLERRHQRTGQVTRYYPRDFAYHYFVSRAFADGPVPELRPAVDVLAAEVEGQARRQPDGTVCWPGEETHVATACAVMTLLHAGGDPALVEGGCRALRAMQDPVRGSWPEMCCGEGVVGSGHRIQWRSRAAATALVMHVLCEAALRRGGRARASRQ